MAPTVTSAAGLDDNVDWRAATDTRNLTNPPEKAPHDRARRVDLTGDHRATIYTAARRLLAAGADPADIIETWRNGQLSMSATIGEAAKWTIREKDDGDLSLLLVRWRPFPATRLAARTALPTRDGKSATASPLEGIRAVPRREVS